MPNEEVISGGETVNGFEFNQDLGDTPLNALEYSLLYWVVAQGHGRYGMLDECGFYPAADFSDSGDGEIALSEIQIEKLKNLPMGFVVNLLVESLRFQNQENGFGEYGPSDQWFRSLLTTLNSVTNGGN